MADKKTTIVSDDAELVVLKAKSFWEKNSKIISYLGLGIIAVIVGWYSYNNFIKLPKEKSASEAIFPAENLFIAMATAGFNKDSVNKVLNGGVVDGTTITGLLKVISKFSGTGAGNRANYMAGACYLHINEYDKAIKYLKEFDANGAHQIESRAYVMLGHAYAEKNNKSEALSNYKKAASVNEKDEAISADALMLAANYADVNGDSKEAISLYEKIKEKYPASSPVTSGEVDKFLARLGVIK
jgi:tetratricopeptide (TPR) repeat protein